MKLFDELSARENLVVTRELQRPVNLLGGFLRGNHTLAADGFDADEVLAALGISAFADAQVASLPVGVRRLVEIGRVLMVPTKLLLLDEPSSGLDRPEVDRVKAVVQSL